jgi:hypothetical protein
MSDQKRKADELDYQPLTWWGPPKERLHSEVAPAPLHCTSCYRPCQPT